MRKDSDGAARAKDSLAQSEARFLAALCSEGHEKQWIHSKHEGRYYRISGRMPHGLVWLFHAVTKPMDPSNLERYGHELQRANPRVEIAVKDCFFLGLHGILKMDEGHVKGICLVADSSFKDSGGQSVK